MELSESSQGCIQGLIYVIQFSSDPSSPEDVEHAIRMVVQKGAFDCTPADFVAAIREALDSETQLSSLIPQPHSETVIRRFLLKVLERLCS